MAIRSLMFMLSLLAPYSGRSSRSFIIRSRPPAPVVYFRETTEHPFVIGRHTGEQSKGLGCLKDRHPAAIQRAVAERPRPIQQFSLEREVNNFSHPMYRAQQFNR